MPSANFRPSQTYKSRFDEIDWSNTPKPQRRSRAQSSAARSDLAFPMVIRDHIAPTLCHADGRTYESRTGFQNGVKEAGKRMGKDLVIVGDDKSFGEPKSREWKPDPTLKQDIKDSWDKVVGT